MLDPVLYRRKSLSSRVLTDCMNFVRPREKLGRDIRSEAPAQVPFYTGFAVAMRKQ